MTVRTMFIAVLIALTAPKAFAQGQLGQPYGQPYGQAPGCPTLATLDMMKQRLEMLRAQREAGIYRLPTAEHQQRAFDSLYRWYWTELSQIERQRAAIESTCEHASQMRDDAMVRQAPAPEPTLTYPGNETLADPNANDPFSGPRPSPTYPPGAVRTYPPYRDPRTGMEYPGPVAPEQPRAYPRPRGGRPRVERLW